MRATALGAYLWWDDIQIFFSSISQIFLILEKSCKQKRFSCLDYFYCGHRMMNGWGLPIPGHEYLTFYQMMLRISTGSSQPWLYWRVWQAMLLIREHCDVISLIIVSAPEHHRALWDATTDHRDHKDWNLASTMIAAPATLHWLFKNHSQIFWNNLMPTIFYWMTAKVLSNFTFGDSLPGSPGTEWYITACTCSHRHYFLHKIFSSFNSNIFCLLLNI